MIIFTWILIDFDTINDLQRIIIFAKTVSFAVSQYFVKKEVTILKIKLSKNNYFYMNFDRS